MAQSSAVVQCPVCSKSFINWMINGHVEQCLSKAENNDKETKVIQGSKTKDFNNSIWKTNQQQSQNRQKFQIAKSNLSNSLESPTFSSTFTCPPTKKVKFDEMGRQTPNKGGKKARFMPLAEAVRPQSLLEYVGQTEVVGNNFFLKNLLVTDEIPSMIFWGPPGCGKTTLANVIANSTKKGNTARFVKLSATMSGVAEVKDAIKVAKNEQTMFQRKTILFIDEIHRFNKLQQDTFLPHIENGTITMIGATTENPSFHINSALLSRCRVIVLKKLSVENIVNILQTGVNALSGIIHENEEISATNKKCNDGTGKLCVQKDALVMLANLCDGDARSALNGLEIAFHSKSKIIKENETNQVHSSCTITVDDIKESFQRSHVSYDKNGEEHYNIISALHKSIRGSDENAALYWLGRMLVGGEEPLYIARRLVRMASEDIGIADPLALNQTISAFQACHFIGKPECDVILAQVTVYLARAPKSVEVYKAYGQVVEHIKSYDGVLPGVPLHLRNAPTKLLKEIGYAKGYKYNPDYNKPVDQEYLPKELNGINFFEGLKS